MYVPFSFEKWIFNARSSRRKKNRFYLRQEPALASLLRANDVVREWDWATKIVINVTLGGGTTFFFEDFNSGNQNSKNKNDNRIDMGDTSLCILHSRTSTKQYNQNTNKRGL